MAFLTFILILLVEIGCPHFNDNHITQHVISLANEDNRLGLFEGDDVLDIRISGNIQELLNDRGDDRDFHHLEMSLLTDNTVVESVSLRGIARGNFRRLKSNCKYPPLELNFEENIPAPPSFFANHKKMKLVVPCSDEKYVVREYLAYKLYQVISEKSFRVRMLRLEYQDTHKNQTWEPFYAFLIEDEDMMASQNKSMIIKRNQIRPQNTDKESFLKMSVFQYLIGNTDWSIQYRHNIKLIYSKENAYLAPVPYDFDLTGMVSAPYAKPAEELEMRNVRQRRYRGYCLSDIKELNEIFEEFITRKEDIEAVISDCEILEQKDKDFLIKYIADFYKILEDPKKCKEAFLYPCDKRGTGNVIITGMKKRN